MPALRRNPVIYEINTWVWLQTLSNQYGYPITLDNVPPEVIKDLASYQFDAIWLMGVWYRSKGSRDSALNYVHEYRGALPDITTEDVVGSAYAIGAYEVDMNLGGESGLAIFRKQIAEYGMRLILDFVPNHVVYDHPAIQTNIEYFVTGTEELLKSRPNDFFQTSNSHGGSLVVAHGRDPYFPGWIDTAQLNAFSDYYRNAAVQTLVDIASQCDGVRCDMAMLVMNSVFSKTWGWLVGDAPQIDFWDYVIPQVRQSYPDFFFMAEVYWNMEAELLEQHFDYTYDKRMYDRLMEGDVNKMYDHLQADIDFVEQNIRFIENHDEPRAESTLGAGRSRPSATLITTLPGATLLHDGQFTGRKIKLPVQIARQPDEPENQELKQFYRWLMQEKQALIYERGNWKAFGRHDVSEGNNTHHHLFIHGWRYRSEHRLIVLNFGSVTAKGMIEVRGWRHIGHYNWEIRDELNNDITYHSGDVLAEYGMFVEVEPYGIRFYDLRALRKTPYILNTRL